MNQASVEEGNGLKSRTTRTTESNTEDDSMAGSFVAGLIYVISMILIICTFPFSLCVCVRMVQVNLRHGWQFRHSIITYNAIILLFEISFSILFRNMREPSSLDWDVSREEERLALDFSLSFLVWTTLLFVTFAQFLSMSRHKRFWQRTVSR